MTERDRERLLQAVHELAPTVAGRSAEIERGRRLPPDLLAQLKAAGCFRMFVPRSHGGLEMDTRAGMQVLEALARADGATGWTVMIGAEAPHLLALLPRARFDAIYAAGPDVIVAGGFNAQGHAEATEGGYRVNGRWSFATGSEHADYVFGNCVVLEGGAPRSGPTPDMPVLRAMLFPAAQGRIVDTWHVLGLRGTGSHDLVLEDARCREEDSFDIFAGGPSVPCQGLVTPLLHFVLHMAAVAVGVAQGALDDTVALAHGGKQRLYAKTRLAEAPLFQQSLGRAEMDVRAARALIHALADELWSALAQGTAAAMALAPRVSGTLAWATEAAARAVDTCYRAGGGGAARDASPLQRRFRDIHTFSQHAAAAEGWFAQVGAGRLGLPTGFWT